MSFYHPLPDGSFAATVSTRGPWSNDHQHAGPPSALMVRGLEQAAAERGSYHLVRVLIELYRPIPIASLTLVTTQPVPGRRVLRLETTLRVDDKDVAQARGLFMRTTELELPSVESNALPPPREAAATEHFPFFLSDEGYHMAMELRFTHGGFGQASSGVWMRQRVPLVEGEDPSPAQRTLVVADSGNGVTNVLDKKRFSFVNADLCVSWVRPPRGEWIHMDARTEPDPAGSGLAYTMLSDEGGGFGRGVQSLFLSAV